MALNLTNVVTSHHTLSLIEDSVSDWRRHGSYRSKGLATFGTTRRIAGNRTSYDSPSQSGNGLDQVEVPDPVSHGPPFIVRTLRAVVVTAKDITRKFLSITT